MNYRILADGHTVHNDTWQTGLNNNDIIIGPSGAGKTRGYVKPNILQTAMQGKESMIITDTKGRLCRELGGVLRQRGYNVLELNLADCSRSNCGYNPLEFVRYDKANDSYNTQDIMRIAAILTPVECSDAFWDYYARQLLAAMISYVLECLPRCEHGLNTVVRLFQQTGGKNFDKLFNELCEIAPDSFAATQYQMFRLSQAAEKMYSSTLGILAENCLCSPWAASRSCSRIRAGYAFLTLRTERPPCFCTSATPTEAWTGWRPCSMRRRSKICAATLTASREAVFLFP